MTTERLKQLMTIETRQALEMPPGDERLDAIRSALSSLEELSDHWTDARGPSLFGDDTGRFMWASWKYLDDRLHEGLTGELVRSGRVSPSALQRGSESMWDYLPDALREEFDLFGFRFTIGLGVVAGLAALWFFAPALFRLRK